MLWKLWLGCLRKVWLHALCGWHAWKSCVYVQHVNSRLEKMWPQEFAWASGILLNLGDFNLNGWKAERFHRRSILSAPVCAAQLSLTLSYISGYKKKEKKLIIFLYISVVVFLCYTAAVDQFINLGSNISSTKSYVNICIGKAWIGLLLTGYQPYENLISL